MNKSERDKSGFLFSTQAVEILDEIYFTPEGADRFFKELLEKQGVELSRFRAHFFLRGNKVCISRRGME